MQTRPVKPPVCLTPTDICSAVLQYFLCSARRTKQDNHCSQRPASEGVLNFSSLFSSTAADTSREQRRASRFACAEPWGAGRDLPSLLEQVSFKARRDAGGVSKDDTATLPRRRVNLFSSLRLRRREGSVSEGPDQELQREIKTILTNLKNKGQFPPYLRKVKT